ncbi:MAG: hypothetical protein Q4A21_01185 [bacterium]|nr:hypothetical protein [bacterium]
MNKIENWEPAIYFGFFILIFVAFLLFLSGKWLTNKKLKAIEKTQIPNKKNGILDFFDYVEEETSERCEFSTKKPQDL